MVVIWDRGCGTLILPGFLQVGEEARARKTSVTTWEGRVGRGMRMEAAFVCSPFRSRRPRAELGWVQNRLKAAAQPGLSLGRAPPPADGCWVQKRRRCCRASPPAALSLPSCCPEPPCCPGRTHEAVIDPGPVVNERNIGVNELGPDNTVTTRLAGRGRASVSPAIFWTN